MKTRTLALLSIVAITLLAGCSSETTDNEPILQQQTESVETIELDQLVERNGQSYKVKSEIPFSGHVVATHTNGQEMMEANFKDGKQDGKTISWHANGQKQNEATYKAGNLDGIFTE